MFRMLYLTFYGKFRGTHEQEHHLHESPPSMTFPLIILAILSALGGLLGLPEFLHLPNWMHHQIGEVIIMKGKSLITLSHEVELILMCLAVAAAAASIFFAYNLYLKNKVLPVANESELKSWQRLIYNKFYVDEIYEALIRKPIDAVSDVLYKYVDVAIIDGVVNGVGSAVKGVGSVVRLAQNGNIGFYIISMIMGIVFIVLFTLLYR
jgi:NADH-quinone oxidoreductase subunit L